MRHLTMLRGAACAAVVGAALVAAASAASAPLPFVREPKPRPLRIELRGGELQLTLDAAQKPRIEVVRFEPGGQTPPPGGYVIVEEDQGVLVLRQPHGEPEVAPPLRVALTMPPGTRIDISGERLRATVVAVATELREGATGGSSDAAADDAAVPRAGQPQSAEERAKARAAVAEAARPTLRFELRDSEVDLRGLGAELRGSGTRYTIEQASGSILAKLEDADVDVRGFDGTLDVVAARSRLAVSEGRCDVQARLDAAQLTLRSGRGAVRADSRGGGVALFDWQGSLTLAGEDTRAELRRSGDASAIHSLSGPRLDAAFEEVAGALQFTLDGGRLEIRGLKGRIQGQAHNAAELLIGGVDEFADLTLQSDARLDISGVSSRLGLRVERARALVRDVAVFELEARGATIDAAGIGGRSTIKAADTELELDLAKAGSGSRIDLSGATHARIVLPPAPCILSLEGTAAETSGRLTVSGCELRDSVGTYTGAQRPSSVGAAVVQLKLDARAEADVRSGL